MPPVVAVQGLVPGEAGLSGQPPPFGFGPAGVLGLEQVGGKPGWPGVAFSMASRGTLCVNGRLRAKAVTCSGVALSTTLPPRLRGWPSCALMPVPPCIRHGVSDSGRPRSPCPRGRVGRMWRSRPGRWSVRRR